MFVGFWPMIIVGSLYEIMRMSPCVCTIVCDTFHYFCSNDISNSNTDQPLLLFIDLMIRGGQQKGKKESLGRLVILGTQRVKSIAKSLAV